MNMENNLFGTESTFLEFTVNFKAILHTLEADIKGTFEFNFRRCLSVGEIPNYKRVVSVHY